MTARVDLTSLRPPSSPGVYIFRDGRKRPIYIGKALSLADRLGSYGQKALPERTMRMLEASRSVDWMVVKTEIEALLCEAALVRQYKPRFNVMLRDDKRFPMILVTDEPFPKALKVRRARHGQGRHFGPFRPWTCNHLLEIVSRRYLIRRCGGPLPKRKRPCIDYDIGRCKGPCVGWQDREDYAGAVESAVRLLGGETRDIIRELRAEMAHASSAMEFEKAAGLRDEIAALEALEEKQNAERPGREDADAVAVALGDEIAAGVVLMRRGGVVMECRRYVFDTPIAEPPVEIVRRTLQSRLETGSPAPQILVPAAVAQAPEWEAVRSAALGARAGTARVAHRGPDAALAKMAEENAADTLRLASETRTHTFRNAALAELMRLLDMAVLPRSIEGFDISTMAGKDTVASCVRFNDAAPKKTFYRTYRIRGRQDSDVDAMEEVLSRRANAKEKLPDLILIDGGQGQLEAARHALIAAGANPPRMISLEKKEELVRTLDGELIRLPASSPALRLLQQVRDEAHRFARNYHLKVRGASS